MTVEGHHALSRVNPPEGRAFYYCPSCGRAATFPYSGRPPWCLHFGSSYSWWPPSPAGSDWTPMRPAVVYAEPER